MALDLKIQSKTEGEAIHITLSRLIIRPLRDTEHKTIIMDNKSTDPLAGINDTCIYCGGSGPFSKEHVFPAGLGGDDNRYVLENLVCSNCNTGVFSPLELQFMRNSPVAIARIFYQPQGRKSKVVSKTSLQPTSTTVFDSNEDVLLEAELTPGGNLRYSLKSFLQKTKACCFVHLPLSWPGLFLKRSEACWPTGWCSFKKILGKNPNDTK